MDQWTKPADHTISFNPCTVRHILRGLNINAGTSEGYCVCADTAITICFRDTIVVMLLLDGSIVLDLRIFNYTQFYYVYTECSNSAVLVTI